MIDTNQVLTNFDGVAIVKNDEGDSLTVGGAIASILVAEKSADPLRSYMLAQSVYNGDEIKEADLPFIKTAVKATGTYRAIVVGQLLSILEAKHEEKK